MKKLLLAIALCVGAAHALAAGTDTTQPAAEAAAQEVSVAGAQSSLYGGQQNFTGRVRIDPLYPANRDISAAGAYVTFEPGARSAWHTHPKGQYLVVTAGVGLTQEWGKPVQVIRPGEVVWCPPGVKHWHGAAPNTAMTHLAVTGVLNGNNVNWLERVSDAQYLSK